MVYVHDKIKIEFDLIKPSIPERERERERQRERRVKRERERERGE